MSSPRMILVGLCFIRDKITSEHKLIWRNVKRSTDNVLIRLDGSYFHQTGGGTSFAFSKPAQGDSGYIFQPIN